MLDPGTIQVRFEAITGSFLIQLPKMPRERGARDAKEFGGLPLITRSLFVNEADVSGDCRSKREIATGVISICFWQI